MGTLQTSPVKETELWQVKNRLGANIGNLHTSILNLKDRLKPISKPDCPEVNDKELETQTLVPYAQEIDEMASRIKSLSYTIEMIIQRLEI